MPSVLGRVALLVVLASCDAGEKPAKRTEPKQPTPPVVAAVMDAGVPVASDAADVVVADAAAAAKTVPAGPYVVHYDCFHSDAPFGPGTQTRKLAYDLGAGTVASQSWETHEDPMKAPPRVANKANVPPKPAVTKLTAAHVSHIEAAVIKVLAGGPFKPEYPVPEGTVCTLQIDAAGNAVFTLEKAYQNEKDAATDLLKALAGP